MTAAENNQTALCKPFLFAFCNPTCQFLSGMFIVFVTGVTTATARGRSESQLLEWLGSKFHKVVFGVEWSSALT